MGHFINLGSGQRPFAKPWINVDVQERWKPDVVADGASMPMFADGSADMIVLSHTLEHYGCNEGDRMLKECYRILRDGGSLIVSVPDVVELFKALVRGKITEETFMIGIYGAYMGDEADRHKFGFTAQSLARTLYEAGFSSVRTFDNRHIAGMDLASDFWILSQEAIK